MKSCLQGDKERNIDYVIHPLKGIWGIIVEPVLKDHTIEHKIWSLKTGGL